MKHLILIISIGFPCSLLGQVTDSFADGELHQNPTWTGDSAHFMVTSGKELRSNAPSQNANSSLTTPSQAMGNAEWHFYVELDFNPSSANYLDVHIASTGEALDTTHPSYFVRIGDTEDEVALYRRGSSSTEKLIDGPDGMTDKNPVELRVKVQRSGGGEFSLAVDTSGGSAFVDIGTGYDASQQISSHFGFDCHYTPTRSDKFYLDDINLTGSPYQDSLPPVLDSLRTPSKGNVQLLYNEELDTSSFSKNGFHLTPYGGIPDSIACPPPFRRIELRYPQDLPNDVPSTLTIPSLEDTAGNQADTNSRSFRYLIPDPPEKGAVRINELMADPTPPVSLPEREYLELHATDTLIQDLNGWSLHIDGDSSMLPQRILKPGDRVLLIPQADSSLFSPPEPPVHIQGSFTLSNAGSKVVLKDSSGMPIDRVHYSKAWYGSNDKDDGGWALERIDPNSDCSEDPNWKASTAASGGTPGLVNAVHQANADQEAPGLIEVRAITDSSPILRFTEPVYPDSSFEDQVELLNGPSIDTLLAEGNRRTWRGVTDSPLDSGKWYEAKLQPVQDCFGNLAGQPITDSLVLPYQAREKDVVINEILYDPEPGGKDYVECYNRSDRILDMSEWKWAHYRDSISGHEAIGAKGSLLAPKSYRFFTEDPEKVERRFPGAPLNRGVKMVRLPSYPNDSGTVILTDGNGKVLARSSYRSSMQYSLLQEDEGVALERIDPSEGNAPFNWHSAASSEDHGTPGEQNSQYMKKGPKDGKERLWSEPSVFTPDMDGDRDVLRIHYRFSRPGMNCSLAIHDPEGRRVKRLANGELFEQKGSLIWDGTRSDGSKAPLGIYVILLDCLHPKGKRVKEKSTCVVGTRWEGR